MPQSRDGKLIPMLESHSLSDPNGAHSSFSPLKNSGQNYNSNMSKRIKNRFSKKHLYTHTHSSIVHNNQKVDMFQTSNNRRTGKHNVLVWFTHAKVPGQAGEWVQGGAGATPEVTCSWVLWTRRALQVF